MAGCLQECEGGIRPNIREIACAFLNHTLTTRQANLASAVQCRVRHGSPSLEYCAGGKQHACRLPRLDMQAGGRQTKNQSFARSLVTPIHHRDERPLPAALALQLCLFPRPSAKALVPPRHPCAFQPTKRHRWSCRNYPRVCHLSRINEGA